ncbi:hypothetical protein ASD12_27875 [Mesorhizobium sp. Root102]|uniref:hypothetical protein n=1 Tax=Mesorhizobium sp. Root102 TaxID=1736422 RepID=UPI0007020574|nr:hypothetical protein [Mesorhizobium sp. Root102]KQU90016.1 hypothetical protein ASD12_27875 [Mesorhizobium sp. Root102]
MADGAETFFISVLGGIASGLVGLAGLAIQQRFTANTQMIDATLAELEQMTAECVSKASSVWMQPGDPLSPEVDSTISSLHDINVFANFVTSRVHNSKMRIDSAFLNFRQAATGDNFDVKDRAADPARVVEIKSKAASLRIAFRELNYERKAFHIPFLTV